jgi:farnesyl-diphosphate farnesyltransferase
VNDELGKSILKEVSRSFYLTLRLLPGEMQEPVSLGYLLARTSDTIADTEGVPVEQRVQLLTEFANSIAADGSLPLWPAVMLENTSQGEAVLLARTGEVADWLRRIDQKQAELIREVVATIIGGQQLDLQRFDGARGDRPVALPDAQSLEDYTWRVAGCVGAFWTKLGFLTLGGRYSDEKETELLARGIAYGKGLQLVNILRDLSKDLADGRCYLPVEDVSNSEALMREYAIWHQKATEWIGLGVDYASTLRGRRLRAATVLPAFIAEETLELLKGKPIQNTVKVPRPKVYRLLADAWFF